MKLVLSYILLDRNENKLKNTLAFELERVYISLFIFIHILYCIAVDILLYLSSDIINANFLKFTAVTAQHIIILYHAILT